MNTRTCIHSCHRSANFCLSTVSLLIDMGYNAVAIAERMGHESIDITYRYAHLFPTVQSDMANKLNTLMEEDENV